MVRLVVFTEEESVRQATQPVATVVVTWHLVSLHAMQNTVLKRDWLLISNKNIVKILISELGHAANGDLVTIASTFSFYVV